MNVLATLITCFFALLLAASPCAAVQKAQGSLKLQHLLSAAGDGESAAVTINLNWTLWTLLDEPVINSTASWQLHSVTVVNDGRRQTVSPCLSKNLTSEDCIPAPVLQKVRIYGLEVFAACNLFNMRHKEAGKQLPKTSPGLLIDPGVMGKPSVEIAGGKALKGGRSYNMPGSPAWNHLFRLDADEGSETGSYVSEAVARGIVQEGVNLHLAEIRNISFDLSAVKTYLLEQRKAAAKEADPELAALTERRDRVHAEKQHIDENDFLGAFESEYLTAQVDDAYQQSRERVLEPFAAEEAAIKADKARIDRILAAKREEIDARSLPGTELIPFRADNSRYGYKSAKGKTVIPATYGYAEAFHEGRAAVKNPDTGRWGFIDTRGTLVIPYRYTQVTPFREGASSVFIHNRYEGHCSRRRQYGTEGVIGPAGRWLKGPVNVNRLSPEFCLQTE